MYYLNFHVLQNEKTNVCSESKSEELLWHKRFAHLGYDNLRKFVNKDMVSGVKIKIGTEHDVCENCCDGKISRKPFHSVDAIQATAPLELIHTDVCGKMNPCSNGGGQYFLTFIDHFSHYVWVYILKEKSQVFEKFKEWKLLVEKQFNKSVKILQSDNGGEYTSNEFQSFLKSEEIKHEKLFQKHQNKTVWPKE